MQTTCPQGTATAVVKGGTFYLYYPSNLAFHRVSEEGEQKLDLPAFAEPSSNGADYPMRLNDPVFARAGLCVSSEGIVLTGRPAADGSSDTFILRDGSDSFEPYGKRASEARVQSVTACTYRGRLFVIGSS